MAEELHRVDSNLKPSELKAAFKRSRDIDAFLDEEREFKEKEVQMLILGKEYTNLWVHKFLSCYSACLLGRGAMNISFFISNFG